MNLFLIVYSVEDGDTDWFLVTSEKEYLQYDDEVKKLVADSYEIELDEFDNWISDYWVNKISEVDGYKVNLVKE